VTEDDKSMSGVVFSGRSSRVLKMTKNTLVFVNDASLYHQFSKHRVQASANDLYLHGSYFLVFPVFTVICTPVCSPSFNQVYVLPTSLSLLLLVKTKMYYIIYINPNSIASTEALT
jgi:hypothetical protein